ncbi:MAG: Cell division and transport-associated protein TolA [Rhodobacteraceae bacterium HLUCCA08]|nr:MAG: Cell division and transport-associated protein TolA [Rhodobacteraceae bacterium HLUCCA08]
MSIGGYVSGTGHALFVLWLIAGWGLESEPLPFEFTEISVISAEDFAALSGGGQPDLPPSDPPAPVAPLPFFLVPNTPAGGSPPVPTEAPQATPPPEAETPPQPVAPTPPPAEVVPEAPPAPEPPAPFVPPPPDPSLQTSPRPMPRPAPRVAPEVVAPPPPDAQLDEETQEATQEAETPDVPAEAQEEVEDTTAPEEATDRIVTEADIPASAPETSIRPPVRPSRPAPQTGTDDAPTDTAAAEPEPDDAPDGAPDDALGDVLDDVVGDIADADAASAQPPRQGLAGGTLSASVLDGFKGQIRECWSLGSVSTTVLATRVTVAFSLTEAGMVDTSSIRMIEFEGGSQADADIAYRAARSALVRCQSYGSRSGYDLPGDQYDLWRNVEIVFDPSTM